MKTKNPADFFSSFSDITGEKTLLDVRTPEETVSGVLPNATLIPLDKLESNMGKIDKHKPVFIYCRSGNRAQKAAIFLEANGVKNCFVAVDGGYDELIKHWKI